MGIRDTYVSANSAGSIGSKPRRGDTSRAVVPPCSCRTKFTRVRREPWETLPGCSRGCALNAWYWGVRISLSDVDAEAWSSLRLDKAGLTTMPPKLLALCLSVGPTVFPGRAAGGQLNDRAFTESQVCSVMSQVIRALVYMHETAKICHRDLKVQYKFVSSILFVHASKLSVLNISPPACRGHLYLAGGG